MANKKDIKEYLIDKDDSYLNKDISNGKILMLSGVWGSGKTHFWKNEVESGLIKKLEKNKSYVFISLYGKDSIEELQNEIQQLSYHFSSANSKDIISSTYSVFTKVVSFIPKFSFNAFGVGAKVDPEKTIEKLEEENIKQQIEQGVGRLKDGGMICFDDFERKSSKIDLNDLFGFTTNLTEEFQTKTIIIINQEFFVGKDSEVFNRIKEKSVNKFLLFNPTVKELFNAVYDTTYKDLDTYKSKILEAIKITEEKNARIFIQVLDNCMEYYKYSKNEYEVFMLVLITTLFIKSNIIFRMKSISFPNGNTGISATCVESIPRDIFVTYLNCIDDKVFKKTKSKERIIDILKSRVGNDDLKEEEVKEYFLYIQKNKEMLYYMYKYIDDKKYFNVANMELVEKLNNFVETGILLEENAKK